MRVVTVELEPGDAGVHQTVAAMREITRAASVHPAIRAVASPLAGSGRLSHSSHRIANIRQWLARHSRFVDDPWEAEVLYDPVWQLVASGNARQRIDGDCDDAAMLGAALGLAVGMPAQFVVVAAEPLRPRDFSHVYAELCDGTRWHELDIFRPREGSRITRRMVVDVTTGVSAEARTMARFVSPPRQRSPYDRMRGYPRAGLGFDQGGYTGGTTGGTNLFTPAGTSSAFTVPGWVSQGTAWVQKATGTVTQAADLLKQGQDLWAKLKGYATSPTEGQRIDQNADAEGLAMAGNEAALAFLRARMDDTRATFAVPGYPNRIGGWASDSARNDAERRYENVVTARGLGDRYIPGTNIPKPPGGNTTLILGALAIGAFLMMRKR